MNKKVIFVSLGVIAVAAVGYAVYKMKFAPANASSDNDTRSYPDVTSETTPEEPAKQSGSTGRQTMVFPSKKEVRQENREIRRDCKAEAKAHCGTGLGKGKPKCRRNFRRDCKAAGGVDDGKDDFAFYQFF